MNALETNPELREILTQDSIDRVVAESIGRGSRKVVTARCDADGCPCGGSTYNAEMVRIVAGKRCPLRPGGKGVVAGVNSLRDVFPEIEAELVDRTVGDTITSRSGRSFEWRCLANDSHPNWVTSVGNRTVRHSGCPTCAKESKKPAKQFIAGLNDLATIDPDWCRRFLVNQDDAIGVSPKSKKRLMMICPRCGGDWLASPFDVRRDDGRASFGCYSCAERGFSKKSSESIVYIEVPRSEFVPIVFGITGDSRTFGRAHNDSYSDCIHLGHAVGPVAAVVSAEAELKSIPGRPRGKVARAFTESLHRSAESIDLFVDVASKHGLEMVWTADLDETLSLLRSERKLPIFDTSRRIHHCHHEITDGVLLHDAGAPCCIAARKKAAELIASNHYLESMPRGSVHVATAMEGDEIVGVITIGSGSSPTSGPSLSTYSGIPAWELTRMWIDESAKITASSFISSVVRLIRYPFWLYSYADAVEQHHGGVYIASGFNYAGWSDMASSRQNNILTHGSDKPRSRQRSSKHRFWRLVNVSGRKRQDLLSCAGWPSYDHRILGFAPFDGTHRRVYAAEQRAALIHPR